MHKRVTQMLALGLAGMIALWPATPALAEGQWEVTADSEAAVRRGLDWLARNQGPEGNWESNDLGLVALGLLAFLSDGHMPDRGPYGANVRRALDFILNNQRPSGLFNMSQQGRDMYNHGLTVFVLTQAYGVTNDPRISQAVDRGLKLIADVQAEDGGWDYIAKRQQRGHDLSLSVMQAKAVRGATDIGLDIPPTVVEMAIRSVRNYYKPLGAPDGKDYGDHPLASRPGAFTYDGNKVTTAMAAAGAVCLQEFGQYDDFRIKRSLDVVAEDIRRELTRDGEVRAREGHIPFDAYTMFYVAQGMYQVGGQRWRENYPIIRDATVKSQRRSDKAEDDGWWEGGRVGGTPGRLFGTSVAVFTLSIPNRYLPILQKGEVGE